MSANTKPVTDSPKLIVTGIGEAADGLDSLEVIDGVGLVTSIVAVKFAEAALVLPATSVALAE
ncbi:MAG: hypothetical protein KDA62_07690 [Planctomycetales bacterium]|nr:hypothetical protein [Planctomycetales bacterium]